MGGPEILTEAAIVRAGDQQGEHRGSLCGARCSGRRRRPCSLKTELESTSELAVCVARPPASSRGRSRGLGWAREGPPWFTTRCWPGRRSICPGARFRRQDGQGGGCGWQQCSVWQVGRSLGQTIARSGLLKSWGRGFLGGLGFASGVIGRGRTSNVGYRAASRKRSRWAFEPSGDVFACVRRLVEEGFVGGMRRWRRQLSPIRRAMRRAA